MNPEFIEQLVARVKGSSILEFEYEEAASCIRFRLDPSDVVVPAQSLAGITNNVITPVAKNKVVSSDIGILKLAHPQRKEPFVKLGDVVQEGQIVALLQSGTMLRELTSTTSGILNKQLAQEGDLIGFGQAIFELE